jgi:hypothetical protein
MEPKVKITTKKGTVFNSMQDYRKASASAGVPLDDMSDDQIIEQFSKPLKPGEAPAITVQYGTTEQPPGKGGLASMPGAVSEELSGRGRSAAQAVSEFVTPIAKRVSGLISGAGYGALSVPTSIMRIAGIDPSKVTLPMSFGGQVSGVPIGGAMAPVLGTPLTVKPEKKPEELTIGQIEKELEPKEPEGKIGQFAMDMYTFGKARKGVSALGVAAKGKMPTQVVSAIGGPKVQAALDKASDFGLSLLQEYGKHGDAKEATSAATTGALWDVGLSLVGNRIKSLYKRYGAPTVERWANEAANKAIPFIKGGKRTDQQDIEYKRELAKRLLTRGDDFTEEGAKAITNRFSQTVKSMKNASAQSDEMLNELHRLKLIPEADLRQVDYGSELGKAISEFKNSQVDPKVISRIEEVESRINSLLPKKPKLDRNGNKIPVQTPKIDPVTKRPVLRPDGTPEFEQALAEDGTPLFEVTDELDRLTFSQAEKLKEKINATLKNFYEKGALSPEDQVDKQVKLEYADAIRAAQKKAFDSLEALKKSKDASIPPTSPAKKMNPWQVFVPGESKPVSYQEASLLAMKDADLSKAAWEARINAEPQPDKSTFNEMAAAIGLAQFIHGSLFTPSQLATAWKAAKSQEQTTVRAQRWQRSIDDLRRVLPEALQPATKIPPSMVGKAAAIAARPERSQSPPTMQEWVSQQSEDQSRKSPEYFNKKF